MKAITVGFAVVAGLSVGVALASCGSKGAGGSGGSAGAGGDDAGPDVLVLNPDAAPLPGESTCEVVQWTNLEPEGATHVPVCTPVSYGTNPPSTGDHWGMWAAYGKYTTPVVPREMYVHNLEHGTVVLLHKCTDLSDPDCAAIRAALETVFDTFPSDPLCASAGVEARLLLMPDPLLDTPIAAAAWGSTYTATCIDLPSLEAFAVGLYAKALENTCAGGVDPTMLLCGDGGVPDGGVADGGAGTGGAGAGGAAGGGGSGGG